MKQLLQHIQIELKNKFSDIIIEADSNPDKWYELMVIHEDGASETVHRGNSFDEAFTEVESHFSDYRFDGMNIDIWSEDGPSEDVFYFFSVPVIYSIIYDYFNSTGELNKMDMIGSVIFKPNHICSYESGSTMQGHVYKSEIAFKYFRNVICYLSESEIEDEEAEGSSYNDILELCDGDKTLAQNIFHEVDWQHPSTLYQDLDLEDIETTLEDDEAKTMLTFLLGDTNKKPNFEVFTDEKYRCKGIYQDGDFTIVFDNTSGNCNQEEFISEKKAREWLSGASFDERDYLCKCNNCDTIMRDENPQVGAKKYLLSGNEALMGRLDDGDVVFWGCPKCLTDDYLKDL
jgi:hypothetical protein